MTEQQAEEIAEALEQTEAPKKRTVKKAMPKTGNATERARAIVLERLKNR